MNLKEFLEQIEASCVFLETEGYTIRKVDASVNRNFWYEKITGTEGYRITFGWTQYGDEFHIKGTQGLKRFNEIEAILYSILGGELINYYTIHQNPSVDYIPQNLHYNTTENNIHFIIKSSADILLFTNFLKTFYYQTITTFFEEYKTVGIVSSWLKNNDVENHKNILVTSDNTMMLRKLAIMKISNDEGYKSLFERYKNFLSQKNIENESPYVDMYSIFLKFESYLLNHT